MYHQSSNMFFPKQCDCPCCPNDCPPPMKPKCPCQDDENLYYRPCFLPKPPCHECPCHERPCHECECHACECHECECHDPENYYCRPGLTPCHQAPCADSMAQALCPYVGKQVILCVCGIRMRVLICEICGNFVKAIAISSGRTLYINACKIDNVKVSC